MTRAGRASRGRLAAFLERTTSMRRRWLQFVMVILAGAAAGCSGAQDKDKNKDLDRPRPAEKGK
jgi:hypothetical protein